ncbi:tyrosine-type recombinase/integrase [Alcanivorax sp. 24]|uniref:phage integrase n=1 Tax=Alcanivorax sp. 24 TaxID=2545266 RepID=UPI00106107F3|nr:tyrosine-type recombinase/integrase [Alcanivorax sp. 24]
MIKQLPDGRWLVDVEPVKGHRRRKRFNTKGEAKRFEAHIRTTLRDTAPWELPRKDNRSLWDLAQRWYDLHGKTLKAGKKRLPLLKMASDALACPADRVKPLRFLEYRNRRLENGTHPKTLNNELGFINAVYNKLHRLGDISYPNPLSTVDPLKVEQRELSWLTLPQIALLLSKTDESPNPHLSMVTKVCLSIGARWGEVQYLRVSQLRSGMITLSLTKSGKVRSIPISDDFEKELRAHLQAHGNLAATLKGFRVALRKSGIELPRGQASHVLRHTFAAHFVMNGGNILTLQKILGHASINMTLRYAHLAPDHLREAISLNPFSTLHRQ